MGRHTTIKAVGAAGLAALMPLTSCGFPGQGTGPHEDHPPAASQFDAEIVAAVNNLAAGAEKSLGSNSVHATNDAETDSKPAIIFQVLSQEYLKNPDPDKPPFQEFIISRGAWHSDAPIRSELDQFVNTFEQHVADAVQTLIQQSQVQVFDKQLNQRITSVSVPNIPLAQRLRANIFGDMAPVHGGIDPNKMCNEPIYVVIARSPVQSTRFNLGLSDSPKKIELAQSISCINLGNKPISASWFSMSTVRTTAANASLKRQEAPHIVAASAFRTPVPRQPERVR